VHQDARLSLSRTATAILLSGNISTTKTTSNDGWWTTSPIS
jgi:hypothetical protein